jgi:preprotein translocase subunit SecE
MFNRIKEFFKEVQIEIKKVVYPSKDELVGSTWVVIIAVVVVSLFLGVVDLGLSKFVSRLLR